MWFDRGASPGSTVGHDILSSRALDSPGGSSANVSGIAMAVAVGLDLSNGLAAAEAEVTGEAMLQLFFERLGQPVNIDDV